MVTWLRHADYGNDEDDVTGTSTMTKLAKMLNKMTLVVMR